jgi:Catechol dioxygenase N terminus
MRGSLDSRSAVATPHMPFPALLPAMRLIDEDHITQAVIACHAGAEDERLRDVMTSLVQHLHAFAREVKLTEEEWRTSLRFLAEAGRAAGPAGREPEQELALLSDVLGLTMLVTALNQRRPAGAAARAPLRATFTPPPSSPGAGPVAMLLRALGRDA